MSRGCRRCTILLLIVAGLASAAEPVPVRTADELKANVGKPISAEGVWSDRGKLGSYVQIGSRDTIEISGAADQVNRLFGLWDGHHVRIVGTLRHFEIPPATRAELAASDKTAVVMPPDYYYISIDDLRVLDESHPELGLQWARHRATRGNHPFMLYETWRPVHAEPKFVSAAQLTLCRVPLPADPHEGGYLSVFVNARGRQEYAAGTKELPCGTVIVKEKRLAKTGGKPDELGVMIKRDAGFDPTSADWEFLFVDKAGKVTYDRAEMLNCRWCHATRGQHDFVFRAGLAKPRE